MLYPMKFDPVYKELLWGGNKIGRILGRDISGDKIGESWEVCSHKNGMSIIRNGCLAGKTLQEVMEKYPEEILGRNLEKSTKFPLLVKIIDANDRLSIQVHPDDSYAYRIEGEPGKTEAWYILEAEENASIIYGLKEEITKKDFMHAIQAGDIADTLRTVPVKQGDMVFVPTGMVHTLLEGIVVYEVQQNSDTTYRVYDYGRKGQDGKLRELHIDKAVDVITFGKQELVNFGQQQIKCPYFKMEKITLSQEIKEITDQGFIIYCVVRGNGELRYNNVVEKLNLGDAILIPAILGEFTINGYSEMQLLKIEENRN